VGSIGRQTLDVVARHRNKFKVTALASYNEVDAMLEQIKAFKPKAVSLFEEDAAKKLACAVKKTNPNLEICTGSEGLDRIATYDDADTTVVAVVGSIGLLPTLKAIKAGKDVAVANKETLVCAGEIVMREVKKHGVLLTPIDSEHSAIFQCLQGQRREALKRIILTCSGGAFKHYSKKQLDKVTVGQALAHPTWKMGPKITIDCATLMNKGLEVIEAHWLYGVPYEQIDVVIHPQSIIHSMVEFRDGSIIAQLGVHDMRVPIQYALSYPERLESGGYAFLDLVKTARLDFWAPDYARFPCLKYAYEAGGKGGTLPAVMNAANEVAVGAFLAGAEKFAGIPRTVRAVMDAHRNKKRPDLQDILEADGWAREKARSILAK
jgi:1-deoxy-D-xylulose-5-phosphate reductoisomerase